MSKPVLSYLFTELCESRWYLARPSPSVHGEYHAWWLESCSGFYRCWRLVHLLLKEPLRESCHLLIYLFETIVAAIIWVSHLFCFRLPTKLSKQHYFCFGLFTCRVKSLLCSLEVSKIGVVHGEDIVEVAKVFSSYFSCAMIIVTDAVLAQSVHGALVWGFQYVVGCCSRGIDCSDPGM